MQKRHFSKIELSRGIKGGLAMMKMAYLGQLGQAGWFGSMDQLNHDSDRLLPLGTMKVGKYQDAAERIEAV